jgi:membrane-associated phospholipid phosphatase
MGLETFFFGTEPIAWVQEFFGRGHPLPFQIFSLLGDTWGILFALGLGFWLFGRRALYPLVGVVVAGAAAKLLLASLFSVSRPTGSGIVVYEDLEIGSFPSGHVFQGVGPWGLLYALGHVRLWVPALVATLVALGRVYLGVHFVGDVLAGVVFGALLVWGYWKVWPPVWAWLSERSLRFYSVVAAVTAAGALLYLVTLAEGPRRYEVVGIVLGAALALPAEYRWVRYEPGPGKWPHRLLKVGVGTAGLAAFVAWDRFVAGPDLLLGTVGATLATLWVLVGVPALFARLGWGCSDSAGSAEPLRSRLPP